MNKLKVVLKLYFAYKISVPMFVTYRLIAEYFLKFSNAMIFPDSTEITFFIKIIRLLIVLVFPTQG